MRKFCSSMAALTLMTTIAGIIMMAQNSDLFAIPAFARKYNMSCTTCHDPFPRLKAYGDEFAGNGFVLKEKDAARYFTDTGDKNLSLIRDLPFALRLEGYITHDTEVDHAVDFTSPYLVKLLSGGSLGKNVSYYFYFFLSERGEVAGLEDAFVMFNNLGGSELDIYVGQFQVSDPLFKRELRLPLEDYQVYRVKPFGSNLNLTYDRGIMATYGLSTGTDIALEVINGSGIEAANADRLYDDDKYKAVMGRISQDLPQVVRIGGFAYYGKEEMALSAVNRVTMLGPDLTLALDRVKVNLQYIERRDKIVGSSDNNETRGAIAEIVYWPKGDASRWYATGLFNWVESDDPDLKYRTMTGHVG
ncbi:MAG: hypothetical protein WBP29_14650, partial [Candidatus Zixiibacteriota bacterium]